MKYRITWFKKETGKVHSEGTYQIDRTLKEVVEYYRDNDQLIDGDDLCVMVDPDHFPHSEAGNEPE